MGRNSQIGTLMSLETLIIQTSQIKMKYWKVDIYSSIFIAQLTNCIRSIFMSLQK